ncbi:MAG: PEP-CTERM sorting domain-containing protein [Opitutales bacterium]
MTPIPEPGLAGLVLGVGGFGLALRLRNRQASVLKLEKG